MENTRFHAGEEANDPDLARRIAGLGDLFVNDAFSAAHRAHASTEGVAHHPARCRGTCHGSRAFRFEPRRSARPNGRWRRSSEAPRFPPNFDLLGSLSARVDKLIIGGGMANTFLGRPQGKPVGKSLCERDLLDTARTIVETAERQRLPKSSCPMTWSSHRNSGL